MRIKFFEWKEHEQHVFSELKNSLNIEEHYLEFTDTTFNIGEVDETYDCISIFIDSRLSFTDLDTLRKLGIYTILVRATGLDMLNAEYAKELGIKVLRVASYSPESIAEHVFALLLALSKKIMIDRRKHIAQKDGRDISQMGFCLRGKTIGFYGLGKTGRIAASIAKHGFGMNVLFFDPHVQSEDSEYQKVEALEDLFCDSNIVSVHVPLTDETRQSVNKKVLAFGHNVTLINISRGGVVNTQDCLEALEKEYLSGIGFDVVGNNDSYKNLPVQDNIVLTQHTAFFTREGIESIIRQTFENITNLRPENVTN